MDTNNISVLTVWLRSVLTISADIRKSLIVTFIAVMIASQSKADEPLLIFAASSLQGHLEKSLTDWPQEVVISYGGSGAMARQIAQGAPADLFILANEKWARWLSARRSDFELSEPFLSNRLVLIAARDAEPLTQASGTHIIARLNEKRFAIGEMRSVPAGIYGAEWMQSEALSEMLTPHLVQTTNVRSALALVARQEAAIGLVYATDAAASDAVSVIWEIEETGHSPIRYSAAALSAEGGALLAHIRAHRQAFYDAGFLPPG